MAAITETLRFKIERTCSNPNEVYLRWRTALGAIESHLFTGETEEGIEVSEGGTYQDITQRRSKAIAKPGTQFLTVRAGLLTSEKYDAVASIATSPEVVRAYPVNSGKPAESVYIVPGSLTPKDSAKALQDIEFKIEIRKLNALTN